MAFKAAELSVVAEGAKAMAEVAIIAETAAAKDFMVKVSLTFVEMLTEGRREDCYYYVEAVWWSISAKRLRFLCLSFQAKTSKRDPPRSLCSFDVVTSWDELKYLCISFLSFQHFGFRITLPDLQLRTVQAHGGIFSRIYAFIPDS
jgi:hypothetical protein